MYRVVFIIVTGLLCSSSLMADEVLLTNGSRLIGQVRKLADEKIIVDTEFAGQIKIDISTIRGITTNTPVSIELQSGDRTIGKLLYSPEGGQKITTTPLGLIGIDFGKVSAIWTQGDDSPDVSQLKASLAKAQKPWSARLHLGLNGETGNTDRLAVDGRMELRRETDSERLLIYAQGRSSRENGTDTVKEILGGLKLEVAVDEKWYVFGNTELEFDKFENLDLRSSVSGGVGYFVTKNTDEEFKIRAGVGFQHESFDTGNTDDQAVADLGWNYRKKISGSWLFTHNTAIFPTFEDINDFRLVMENAVEIPLATNLKWKFRLGIRNNYDAMPEKGIDRLDTYYFLNIVADWK